MAKIAIIVLNISGLDTALHIRTALPNSEIWGLSKRIADADHTFNDLTTALPALLSKNYTIIGICAAGILIRILAPSLKNKRVEPPVLAVSEDGKTIVPLIGGLTGANDLAHNLSQTLRAYAAITGSGARKFGIALEAPPQGYVLANPADAKGITSNLLGGRTMQIEGRAPWLESSGISTSENGNIKIKISWKDEPAPANGLLYHPHCVAIGIKHPHSISMLSVLVALKQYQISAKAVATLLLPAGSSAYPILSTLEKDFQDSFSFPEDNIIRYADTDIISESTMRDTLTAGWSNCKKIIETDDLVIAITAAPIDVEHFGRPVGTLSIVGIGPGSLQKMTLESHDCLMACSDWVGYETYLNLVKGLHTQQNLHSSGNRVEIERAREALDLAAQGKKVALVTSGDPGIFAMASAVMELLDETSINQTLSDSKDRQGWPEISINVLPGVSAMQTASSKAGALLGHDFCAISLSDIRKPWDIIETRLNAALEADMVICLYNPASKTRKQQIKKAVAQISRKRDGQTPVLIGKNLERSNETLVVIELSELDIEMIDMRTVLIFGSSKSRLISQPFKPDLVYTPRSYEYD